MRVADDFVPHAPAQEIIDRHAQSFALDVPQRDIDRRDGRHEDALGREKAAAHEQLPNMFDARRVLADQERLEMFDGTDHRHLASGNPRLTDAVNPLIGVDDHKQEIAASAPHRKGLDICDLHLCSSRHGRLAFVPVVSEQIEVDLLPRVLSDDVLVQGDAQTGPVGQREVAVLHFWHAGR